jgi:hypothetical protein
MPLGLQACFQTTQFGTPTQPKIIALFSATCGLFGVPSRFLCVARTLSDCRHVHVLASCRHSVSQKSRIFGRSKHQNPGFLRPASIWEVEETIFIEMGVNMHFFSYNESWLRPSSYQYRLRLLLPARQSALITPSKSVLSGWNQKVGVSSFYCSRAMIGTVLAGSPASNGISWLSCGA